MSKLTYTETTIHGPEVDFGIGWSHDGHGYYRVTWVAYSDPKTGYSERGNVYAFSGGDYKPEDGTLLARGTPLFVAEYFLAQPFNSVGVNIDQDEVGWAAACLSHADISWVEKRLARWNGCDVVTYSGKERYQGEVKAARQYAWRWGFESRQGGWIYTRSGKPFTQGWRSFSADLKASRVIAPIRQEETGTTYQDRRYSETWVVSTTRSTFGA
jgi:hypothetical protein